jgi:hypothetical protein
MKNKTFIIELTVAQNWIDDGFNPVKNKESVKNALWELLPYANEDEIKVKVTKKIKKGLNK